MGRKIVKYEIPKEIKTKPKMMGLEMKELVIILTSSLLILTVLRELVHSVFMLLYFGVSILGLIYLLLPSGNNPKKRIYESIILMGYHKKGTYHGIDQQTIENNKMDHEQVRKEGLNKDGTFKVGKF